MNLSLNSTVDYFNPIRGHTIEATCIVVWIILGLVYTLPALQQTIYPGPKRLSGAVADDFLKWDAG